ncbi:hypothetical protein HOY80DRAFT_996593 [Tuber brumale]|nr:hypothetical protein HOY80DRAFT_996593 [Tuber brumale]
MRKRGMERKVKHKGKTTVETTSGKAKKLDHVSQLSGKERYNINRNLANHLGKTDDPTVIPFQFFPKDQPKETCNSFFELENKKELRLPKGDVIIIMGKIRHGKRGARKQPSESASLLSSTADSPILDCIILGEEQPHEIENCDKHCEGASSQDIVGGGRVDSTARSHLGGSSGGGGCVHVHRAFASRMQLKKKNIALGPGPVATYTTKKAMKTLRAFVAKIAPLTRLVETLFETFLSEDYGERGSYHWICGIRGEEVLD